MHRDSILIECHIYIIHISRICLLIRGIKGRNIPYVITIVLSLSTYIVSITIPANTASFC